MVDKVSKKNSKLEKEFRVGEKQFTSILQQYFVTPTVNCDYDIVCTGCCELN